MGLRQRPGRVVFLSAIPSSGHFEGANITASSTEQLRLTRIQTGPSKCLLPPLNRARTCRWLVWAGATAGAGKHVKYAADGVDRIIDLLGRVCGAEEEAHARRAFRQSKLGLPAWTSSWKSKQSLFGRLERPLQSDLEARIPLRNDEKRRRTRSQHQQTIFELKQASLHNDRPDVSAIPAPGRSHFLSFLTE